MNRGQQRRGLRRLLLLSAAAVLVQGMPAAPEPPDGNGTTGQTAARSGEERTVAVSDRAGMVVSLPLIAAQAGGTATASGATTPAVRPVRVIVKLRNTSAQGRSKALSSPVGAAAVAGSTTPEAKLQALLVKHAARTAAPLSPGHTRARQQAAAAGAQAKAAAPLPFSIRGARAPANATPPDLSTTYVLELGDRPAQEVAATVQSLRADPDVLYAEEDKVVRATYVPNDPSYSSTGSWGQSYADLHGLKRIGTTQAWDVNRGLGVVVAVIDTGIDYNHPDITANVWINPGEIAGNGVDDDHNGFVDDVRGWDFIGPAYWQPVPDNDPNDGHFHGTHVAGTIAAVGDNNLGVVGVAWRAKVMAVKALDDSGTGTDSAVAQAITYAVDNGADVINASLSGEGTSQAIADAINYAQAHGVVFVAAAGNNSADLDAKDYYPANVPAAIAVSALSPSESLSAFSNRGSKVELAAPGEDILSLEKGTNGYFRLEGTSMAAPHVSGVAALVIAQYPAYTTEQVRQALRVSATDLGTTGRDASFGYGRVNAAQAVLVSQALAARITAPLTGTKIAGSVTITGTAQGAGFSNYVVEFGAGAAPSSWTQLGTSATPVANGILATLNPATLSDGIYTVRLRVLNAGGSVFSDQVQIQVRYLAITSPAAPAHYLMTVVMKPGAGYPITGTANGPSFQSYLLEWAPGSAATSGWASTGFVLTGGGLAPVTNGTLGTWTPPATLPAGYYSLRLTVTNTGFSSAGTTSVYAEPSLLAAGWPKFLGPAGSSHSPLPVRQPDGSTRLVLAGETSVNGTPFFLMSLDGTVNTLPFTFGADFQPCVGNLDGLPGDEVVVADGADLKIYSSGMSLIRTISATPYRLHWSDQPVLADLDGDGTLEIIAPVRDAVAAGSVFRKQSGALYVYRADGTVFSANYPLIITSPQTGSDYNWLEGLRLAAADLNGDGRKEIIMAINSSNVTGYAVKVINGDGTPYAGWPAVTFPGEARGLAVADLDNDGTSEIILSDRHPIQLRVLNSTGSQRSGWPVGPSNWSDIEFTVADLDHDGRREIVVATFREISVWNDQGTRWSPAWSTSDQHFGPPLVADIDGDGVPEIIVFASDSTASATAGERWLKAYGTNGSLKRSWRLFGQAGRRVFLGTTAVGDFNNDGLTDLAVNLSLVEGDGSLDNSALTVLTTGTSFNAGASDWTSRLRDPQNSRSLPPAVTAPVITGQPFNQTIVAGQTATFAVGVSGAQVSYQWRKGGSNLNNAGRITGATSATLTITNIQAGDTGSYDVVVTNSTGQVTSNAATLTVSLLGQTITFAALADRAFTASPIALSATASSGLPVSFSIASGPAVVAGQSLTLSGPGTVTVRASQAGDATYAAAPTVDRSFTVSGNFGSWQQSKFSAGDLLDATISGPNADPDHDGFTNLMEYALGLEPKSVSTIGLPVAGTEGADWTYTYTRPSDRTDVTYVVEMSENLTDWSSAGLNHALVSTAGGTETWRAKYPLASAANVFFRLRVTGQ